MSKIAQGAWKDPKLLVGIVLIVGSVAAGAWIFQVGGAGSKYYVTKTALAPGEVLGPESLTTVDSVNGLTKGTYLSPTTLPAGAVVTKPLGKGELVPLAAVGKVEEVKLSTLVLDLSSPLPAGIRIGGAIDLWYLPKPSEGNNAVQASLLAGSALVSAIPSPTSGLGNLDQPRVELRLSAEQLTAVLSARAQAGTIIAVGSGVVGPPTANLPKPAPAAHPDPVGPLERTRGTGSPRDIDSPASADSPNSESR